MKRESGFTLIELMIVIAIIGILASIAVPQYARYTERSKFTEVISATMARKTAVTMCYHESNSFDTCSGAGLAGQYGGIPHDLASPGIGLVTSVSTLAGVITAVGNAEVKNKTITITPTTTATGIIWTTTGSCIDARYCR